MDIFALAVDITALQKRWLDEEEVYERLPENEYPTFEDAGIKQEKS